MKKITLFAIALLASVVSFAALNPFAYGLSSQLSADETKLTVNYSLNADATAVNIVVLDGETTVKSFPCEGIAKGTYSVEIPTTEFPKTTALTWKVEVSGASVNVPTQHKTIYSFYHPSAIDIDNNPENSTFGLILCNEGMQSVKDVESGYVSAGFGAGIFAFNAAFEPMPNGDKPGYNGGITFNTLLPEDHKSSGKRISTYVPRRIRISEDGRIFVTSLDVNGTYLWEINPKNMNEWTPVFKGASVNDNYEVVDGSGNFIAAPNVGFDVRGTGENLKLLMLSINKTGFPATYGAASYRCHEYNLGTADTYSSSPSKLIFSKYAINYTGAQVQYDNEGGVWMCQHRGTASDANPSLMHFNANGEIDFIEKVNNRMNGGFRFNNDFTKVIVAGIAAGTKNSKKATLYAVSKDADGKPVLTQELVIDMTTVGNNLNDFAFDYAGNLYSCGNSSEKLVAWAMPYSGMVATPAPSKYAFKIGAKSYTITATANDAAMGTITGTGTYYEGETVTLTATAKTGHQFVNWSNNETANPLTFTATEDVNLTANFEVLSYTVTALTNDENKGTVEGAGTYAYGTEATLTATPADGYELLYWSDRSKENPRTITVDGDKILPSAYFVKEYEKEPTFTIEKVWENTNVPAATGNGYQAVGWDGKIYMQDAGNKKIVTYASAEDSGTDYATGGGAGQQIAVDEAGNLIVFNATFYAASPNAILIYKKGSTEGKAVSFTLPQPARCDFFSASGDIYSEEGGYVYFYCNGKTVINRLKISNGATTVTDITTDIVGGSIFETTNNQNHVIVDIFGNLVTHARSSAVNSINILTNECATFTLPSIKLSTLGGCSFELGGKEFWAYNVGTTHYNSEWNIYNMTDKKFLSETALYAKNTTDVNTAANWLNVQVVDEKTAYIYQFCPKVAVAVWKVTCDTGEEPENPTALDNTVVAPQVQKIVCNGQVLIIRDGKTFNMMGQEVR